MQRMNCKPNSKATILGAAGLSLVLFALNSAGPARWEITKVVHFVKISHMTPNQNQTKREIWSQSTFGSWITVLMMARIGVFFAELYDVPLKLTSGTKNVLITSLYPCETYMQIAASASTLIPGLWPKNVLCEVTVTFEWTLTTKMSSAHTEVQLDVCAT